MRATPNSLTACGRTSLNDESMDVEDDPVDNFSDSGSDADDDDSEEIKADSCEVVKACITSSAVPQGSSAIVDFDVAGLRKLAPSSRPQRSRPVKRPVSR